MLNIYLKPERVRESLLLLFAMFNIDAKLQLYGVPIKDIMPYLEKDLGNAIIQNEEQATAIMQWLATAINYCTGDIDDLPKPELVWTLQAKSE